MSASSPSRRRSSIGLFARATLAVVIFAPPIAAPPANVIVHQRPNVVVIMADDLDADSVAYMPNVNRLLMSTGVTFTRHTVSYSLCCPSRASYLGGQLSHNNEVYGNNAPTGGYTKFDAAQTLPVWLSSAGYATSHIGKYLNGYDGTQHPTTAGVPPGYTEWNGTVDPLTYRYYGYLLNENGLDVVRGLTPRGYQTDTFTDLAVDFIERRSGTKPFFLDLAYVAPHGEIAPGSDVGPINPGDLEGRPNDESTFESPPVPAARHAGLFANAKAPRPPSFDEADVSDKPGFVKAKQRLTPEKVDEIDNWYRDRLRSLQAVDEGVARIVGALQKAGELDSTFILFTSDNGWEQGEHRLALKKVDVYEASTHIPLVIRGPHVERGAIVRDWTSNVDVQPTILELTHAARPGATFPLDGMSLKPYLFEPETTLGRVVFHEVYEGTRAPYSAIRAGRWKYVVYANGERELYDLRADPYELQSLHRTPATKRIRAELGALLRALKTCKGHACVMTGHRDDGQVPRRR